MATSRPLGVWILTILTIFVSGVIPILSALALLVALSSLAPQDIFLAGLQGALGFMIIWYSIGAWRRNDTARARLIVVVTVFHSLQILSNGAILVLEDVPTQFISRFTGAIFRSIFWIGLTVWYFRRPQTLNWYHAHESTDQRS